MNKIERPLWYVDYYQDAKEQLNLSNNVCYDAVLLDRLKFDIDFSKIHQYPDAASTYLELSMYHNVDPKNIAIGYGAGDIVFRLLNFFKDYSLSILTPTYDLANTFAVNLGMKVQTSTDLSDLNGEVLYIANPNGITGEALASQTVLEMCKKFKYVIADEAYGEFSTIDYSVFYNSIDLENLIVVKTLSKSVASPGIRFGYCVGNVDLIKGFQNARSSTVLTGLTPFFIPVLLKEIDSHVKRMIITRNYIESKYSCKPSQGNYVLFEQDPKLNCKIKKTQLGHYRMALTDLDTFVKLENEQSSNY